MDPRIVLTRWSLSTTVDPQYRLLIQAPVPVDLHLQRRSLAHALRAAIVLSKWSGRSLSWARPSCSKSPTEDAVVSVPVSYAVPRDDRLQSALKFLFGRLNYERSPQLARTLGDFKLARMESFLDRLGNPQLQVPTVHIAGSKGKGSTATMVAGIFAAAGYRTGLFTSPHIANYAERFQINGIPIPADQLVELIERVRVVVELMDREFGDGGPTFFEITTVIGWLWFFEQRVEMAVIEVGLGGRLDSTNVCQPLVSVITSISKDHTRLLGDREESIAREKSGIIKPGVPLVSGVSDSKISQVIELIAQDRGAPCLRIGHEFEVHAQLAEGIPPSEPPRYAIRVQFQGDEFGEYLLCLPGEHQVVNGTLAVIVSRLLTEHGFVINNEHLSRGLANATCPLRVEILSRRPMVIADAAHNSASVMALMTTLADLRVRRRIAIVAFSQDKDVRHLLSLIDGHFDDIVLTRFLKNPRACSVDELEQQARNHVGFQLENGGFTGSGVGYRTRFRDRGRLDLHDRFILSGCRTSGAVAARLNEPLTGVRSRQSSCATCCG